MGTFFERLVETVNGFVWGPGMILLMLGTGLYFSLATGWIQLTFFPAMLNETLFSSFKNKKKKTDKGAITPFQALTTALGGTIGTGNIAGVATALTVAGPGAIFWMLVAALVGMVTKYAEILLAIHYRRKDRKGNWQGGPMAYLERGLGSRFLAITYALLGVLASLGMGNLTQANSIACALEEAFALPPIVTGVLLCALLLFPVLGSVKRIGRITEILVPLMSFFYLLGAFIVIGTHLSQVPHAFSLIFRHAFTPIAPLGGFAGATVALAMQKGISRGVFTNEAGLGSASIAHSAAETDSPVRQGLWGMFEVFFDTIFMCLITAVAILVSGVWQSGDSGAVLTMSAFATALPRTGKYVIALSLTFFALSSIIAWSYYGRQCLNYLTGNKYERVYLYIYIAFAFLGANMGLTAVWELSDALNGLMALPNLFGLICLSPTVLRLTREEKHLFLPQKRRKVPPLCPKGG